MRRACRRGVGRNGGGGGGDAWVGRTPLQAGGGEHAADAKEVVRRAHGPTFTGDRQLLHTNEPTCAPACRARARVAAAAAEGGAEQGDLQVAALGGV